MKVTRYLLLVLLLLLVACGASALEKAEEAVSESDYATALTEFTAALDEELSAEDRYRALTGRAAVHRQLDDDNGALSDLADALTLTDEEGAPIGDRVGVHQQRAVIFSEGGDYTAAAEELTAAIALDPSNVTLKLELATMQENAEDWDGVVGTLDEVLTAQPDNAQALAQRGKAHLELRNFEQAIADLKGALQGDVDAASADVASRRNLADAYADLAAAMRDLGEYEAAAENYTNALEYVSDSDHEASVSAERGFIYSELNQYEDALADLDRAISLDPDLAIAYAYRSYVYTDQENTASAIADASRAVELGDDLSAGTRSALLHALAFARAAEGDLEAAVVDATASIDEIGSDNPDAARTFALRGRIYRDLEQYEQSIADLNQAIDIGSGDVAALDGFYYQRSVTYYELGDYESAIADQMASMAIEEATAGDHEYLGDIYYAADRYDEAISSYQAAIQVEPDSAWLHNYLGDIYYEIEDYGSAGTEYETAIRLDNQVALFHENLGYVQRQLEDYEGALATYDAALALDPERPYSYYGRAVANYWLLNDDAARNDFETALTYDLPQNYIDVIQEFLAELP